MQMFAPIICFAILQLLYLVCILIFYTRFWIILICTRFNFIGQSSDVTLEERTRKAGHTSVQSQGSYYHSTDKSTDNINSALHFNFYEGPVPNPQATAVHHKDRYKEWKSDIAAEHFDQVVSIQWKYRYGKEYANEYHEDLPENDPPAADQSNPPKHPFLYAAHLKNGGIFNFYEKEFGGLLDVSAGISIEKTRIVSQQKKKSNEKHLTGETSVNCCHACGK